MIETICATLVVAQIAVHWVIPRDKRPSGYDNNAQSGEKSGQFRVQIGRNRNQPVMACV
jgi:hypothetical protein